MVRFAVSLFARFEQPGFAVEQEVSGWCQSAVTHLPIKEEEVMALRFFAENFRANSLISWRFDEQEWAFSHPEELNQTDGGNLNSDVRDSIRIHLNESEISCASRFRKNTRSDFIVVLFRFLRESGTRLRNIC